MQPVVAFLWVALVIFLWIGIVAGIWAMLSASRDYVSESLASDESPVRK